MGLPAKRDLQVSPDYHPQPMTTRHKDSESEPVRMIFLFVENVQEDPSTNDPSSCAKNAKVQI